MGPGVTSTRSGNNCNQIIVMKIKRQLMTQTRGLMIKFQSQTPRKRQDQRESDQTNWVTGQNGTGQNGTDKMVRTKWHTDKMVWTKWYGRNGTDKMVVIFRRDYNSSEFNSYLVTKSHNEMINIQRKPKRLKVEAGLIKKSYCQWEWN